MGEVSWLGAIAAAVGPATAIAIIYSRQAGRDAPKITQALLKSRQQLSSRFEERRPARWYHSLALAALVALPFVQWFAYFEYRTALSVLIPLAAAMGIMLVVGMFFPRNVATQPTSHREWALLMAAAAAALGVAIFLPPTGTIVIARGALTDLLGLLAVGYAIRVWHIPGNGTLAQDA